MNNEKVLNQETAKDGDNIVVTKTVEERLTREDILGRLDNCKRQKEALARNSQELKLMYDRYTTQEEQLNEMLQMFPTPEITNL